MRQSVAAEPSQIIVWARTAQGFYDYCSVFLEYQQVVWLFEIRIRPTSCVSILGA